MEPPQITDRPLPSAFLFWCLVLLLCGSAHAQTATAEGDSNADTISLYRRATQKLEAGQDEEAYRLLSRAWQIQPSFDVAMGLGGLELQRGEWVLAATHFTYARQHLPPSASVRHGPLIQEGFAEAWRHVGEVRFTPGLASDARVELDGEPSVAPHFLSPGRHRYQITQPGFVPASGTVHIIAAQRNTVNVELRPAPDRDQPGENAPSAYTYRPRSWVLAVGAATTTSLATLSALMFSRADSYERELDDCSVQGCNSISGKVDAQDSASNLGTGLALGASAAALGTAVLWHTWQKRTPISQDAAKSSSSGVGRALVAGSSAGDPSFGKWTTTVFLHTAAVAGLAGGTIRWLQFQKAMRNLPDAPGSCSSNTVNQSCINWHAERGEHYHLRAQSLLLFSGGALAHLIGLGVAESWHNVTPNVGWTPGQLGVNLHGTF